MRVVGFTGTRNCEWDDLKPFHKAEVLKQLEEFDEFVTGACVGFDAVMGRFLAICFPGKKHTIIVPANHSQISLWWNDLPQENITVVYMPEGSTYKDRNQAIVGRSDALVFCAEYPEGHPKSRRSGTWQTIRMARKARIPVTGITLTNARTLG